MSLEELKVKANALSGRFNGINGWIKDNMNTDPNLYEMFSCTCEYGELYAMYDKYFRENGYPTLEDGKVATHYDLGNIVPELKACRDSINEMFNLRSGSKLFEDKAVKDMSTELLYRAHTGEYIIPEDNEMSVIKRDMIAKIGGVYNYIWQVRRNESEYQYDNALEYKQMTEAYALYKEDAGIQYHYSDQNGTNYSGPQFGMQLEDMLNGINSVYKYREAATSKVNA